MEEFFKSYDVRHTFPELSPEVAAKIGAGLSEWAKHKKVVVGFDGRSTSPLIHDAFTSGLRAAGSDVISLGLVTTPILDFAARKEKIFGAMITASHNPPEYTGIKFTYEDGTNFKEGDLKKLAKISEKASYSDWDKVGKLEKEDIVKEYKDYIKEKLENPLKVAVDAKNGSGSGILSGILEDMGCEVVKINDTVDPSFPNGSQPKEELCGELMEKTAAGCDFGVALDGDGDRAGFVDDKGRFIRADYMLMIFAKYLKPKKIVATLNCTDKLEDFTEVSWCKVGTSFVTEALRNEKAEIAGEFSGHFVFTDKYPFSDGILTAVKLAKLLSGRKEKFSGMIDSLPQTFVVQKKANVPEEKKLPLISKIAEDNPEADTMDGVKLTLSDGWILIRKSNTEPVVRVSCEMGSKEEAEKEVDRWVSKIEKIVEKL